MYWIHQTRSRNEIKASIHATLFVYYYCILTSLWFDKYNIIPTPAVLVGSGREPGHSNMRNKLQTYHAIIAMCDPELHVWTSNPFLAFIIENAGFDGT
jgi:hypothetical protein